MTRTSVDDSSTISGIGYDPASQTLQVAFKGKSGDVVYDHHDVPKEVHTALMASPSKGKYFRSFIRGRFKHTKR